MRKPVLAFDCCLTPRKEIVGGQEEIKHMLSTLLKKLARHEYCLPPCR